LYLGVTYFFADKPQAPVAFPFEQAPKPDQAARESSTASGVELSRARSKATWLEVQRSFGPIGVRRLGIASVEGKVRLLLDASVVLSGLTMDLQGLSLAFPIEALTKFDRKHFLESLKLGAGGLSANLDGLSV